mgnify:FL=1
MKKSKLIRIILTGLVLLVGALGAITVANKINNSAIDINSKNIKATIVEKNGHYYVQLITDKNLKNVVGRIITEDKKEYLTKNMNELGVYYIIWKQRFYMSQSNIYGPANTWNLMPDRGGLTVNHYDHVHVSFVK